ncbi:MAG: translation elongation factor Ts [Sedimentisphaerales bacterium]|nr:translation elongation factor Ts [Sedimentisphaerales bacterium]
MAEITAAVVKELRERTGQAMMDCKKALQETGGDIDKAIDLLRKKGMAVLEKRGGRETKEGQVVSKSSPDGKVSVITMLCSETDFTAKNNDFVAASQALADALLAAASTPADADAFMALPAAGKTVGDIINNIISKTGEKITVGDFARYELKGPGLLFSYVHFNGKIGTMLQLDADSDTAVKNAATKTMASDLAMHITATSPLAVSRDEVDPQIVAKEREIAAEQVKGKPANIIDKIVDGKINKWFQQIALLEQPFVKDDSKSVGQLVEETAKQAGGRLTIKRFTRLQIG